MRQLSQERLANVVNKRSNLTGIYNTIIDSIVHKDYIPSIPQLEKLAETLEFDIETIFEESKPSFYSGFRTMNVTHKEQEGIDYLFNMMLAARQQVMLRRALHREEF